MSESIAGTVIDCLEFARDGAVLERRVGLDELPRLADVLVTRADRLSVRLEGWRDRQGKSWLHLAIAGELVLHCQRCLDAVRFPLAIDSRLQLIAPGEEWPDDELVDDSADAIAAERALSVVSLVEDEVLLALPIAPRHEGCDSPPTKAGARDMSQFAALAAWHKH